MRDKEKEKTVDTYNHSAKKLSKKFSGIGPRIAYIELGLQVAGRPSNPNILEIGCGDGRDAYEIIKRTNKYIGIDISDALIKIARRKMPHVNFEVTNAVDYNYPSDLDVVYCFASILHLDKNELELVFKKLSFSVKTGGAVYISTKSSNKYQAVFQKDEFGERLFFLYDDRTLVNIAKRNKFDVVTVFHEIHGKTEWVELALKKI